MHILLLQQAWGIHVPAVCRAIHKYEAVRGLQVLWGAWAVGAALVEAIGRVHHTQRMPGVAIAVGKGDVRLADKAVAVHCVRPGRIGGHEAGDPVPTAPWSTG